MIYCDTFKEARKAARELLACGRGCYGYIGKIEKGKSKGKYLVDSRIFSEAQFYVHKDGRVCKISDIEKENKKWNRHPELCRRAYPFVYRPRNRKAGENKRDYLNEMAISGRCNI